MCARGQTIGCASADCEWCDTVPSLPVSASAYYCMLLACCLVAQQLKRTPALLQVLLITRGRCCCCLVMLLLLLCWHTACLCRSAGGTDLMGQLSAPSPSLYSPIWSVHAPSLYCAHTILQKQQQHITKL